jgi:predicted Zn-dependent protease
MTSTDRIALYRALAAYDQRRPEEAEPVLRELVPRYPGNFEATETLGLIYGEGGKLSSALPLLEKACVIRPSSALAQANLGTAYLKLHRSEDAVRALKRSAALDPENPETQSALGQALMLAGRAAEAATAFAAANSRVSPNPDLLYNWAVALFAAGNAKRAGEVLARIPERDNSAQIQSLWGDVEEKNAHYAAALRHFQAAAQSDPSETNLYALGMELTRHWTFPAAIKIFEYGVAKHSESARLQLGLAVAKYGNDDYAGSALVLAGLLEKEPENNLYADLLGRNCVLMSKVENSGCEKLERIAAEHPSNAAATLYVAQAILRQPQDEQNTTRARNLLEQAIAANPRLAEGFFQLGVLDQQEMRWQESAAMLEKAVTLRPDYAQAHYRLARAYSHLGQRERAEREIALQQEYSQKDENNRIVRMREVTTFLVTLH